MTTASTDTNAQQQQQQERPLPRNIRRHDRIVTSDEEMKEFNKGYYAKAQSQYLDPCQPQTKASMKCMDENGFDKKKCTRFFKDYSDCKRKWLETLREDRRKKNLGITDDDDVKDTASASS
ncbi:MAG: hypothetical protein J3R72DRAFT_429964 [Linnemannia gamsii]|nr:Mitochondrial copper homeostasis protein [Mortierella sp. AD032]KAK3848148.1 MAG: hypothetical protein J3R72DRAFT_429964 [Linnemannia gamsii]